MRLRLANPNGAQHNARRCRSTPEPGFLTYQQGRDAEEVRRENEFTIIRFLSDFSNLISTVFQSETVHTRFPQSICVNFF
jgi:hypothetical protein